MDIPDRKYFIINYKSNKSNKSKKNEINEILNTISNDFKKKIYKGFPMKLENYELFTNLQEKIIRDAFIEKNYKVKILIKPCQYSQNLCNDIIVDL